MKIFKRIPKIILVIWCCHFQTFVFAQVLEDTIIQQEQNLDTVLIPYEVLDWNCFICIPRNSFALIDSYDELFYFLEPPGVSNCWEVESKAFDFNHEKILVFSFSTSRRNKGFQYCDISFITDTVSNTILCEISINEKSHTTKIFHEYYRILKVPIKNNNWTLNINMTHKGENYKESKINCNDYYDRKQ